MLERIINKTSKKEDTPGSILYYMHREQRISDNPALFFAQQKALEYRCALYVVFPLLPEHPELNDYQVSFVFEGLKQLRMKLKEKGIPFFLLSGKPDEAIMDFAVKMKAGAVITDFQPLRQKKIWEMNIERNSPLPLYVIDGHNVVPCFIASSKQEYGAYTIRKKIHAHLDEYLNKPEYNIENHPYHAETFQTDTEWEELVSAYTKNKSSVSSFKSGEKAAHNMLQLFIKQKLSNYSLNRNNPVADAVSELSPYLHCGQISPRMAARAVLTASVPNSENIDAYIEELIIRRELSDNFCHYNVNYNNINGFPNWAKETHMHHRNDPRENIYSLSELEDAKTHDSLWNAAQMEMISKGKMHGYMRMYWAKKILEWTPQVEQALNIAIYLNDKYSLDGNDPNGYAGIMWSIGGVHDRAWFERPIFGKIRYMNYNGCKGKFNVNAYIKKVTSECV